MAIHLFLGQPDTAQIEFCILGRDSYMVALVDYGLIGISAAMSDPKSSGCAHDRLQGASHTARRLYTLNLSIFPVAMRVRFAVRDNYEPVTAHARPYELVKNVACPYFQVQSPFRLGSVFIAATMQG